MSKEILIFCTLISVIFSCRPTKTTVGNVEEFKYKTLEGVICRLTYEDGELTSIDHYRKNKDYALASYTFNVDGDVSSITKVIDDTIMLRKSYYPSGQLESISYDLDLNPNDTVVMYDGVLKNYHENGQLAYLGYWRHGHRYDTVKYFDSTGFLFRDVVYGNDGKFISVKDYP